VENTALAYKDAVDILMPVLGVPDKRRASFESRMRHVQLIQARSGRDGGRIRYDLDEIALIAFAFSLMGAHLPPRLAIRHIVERRAQTLHLLHAAEQRDDATLLLPGNGLDAIGTGGQDDDIPLTQAIWLKDAPATDRPATATVVEAGRMMRSLSALFAQTVARNAIKREEKRQRRIENNRASSRRYNEAKAAERRAGRTAH